MTINRSETYVPCFFDMLMYCLGTLTGRGRSIIGGAHIHIFVFTDRKNNRFQKKLMMHNTNI